MARTLATLVLTFAAAVIAGEDKPILEADPTLLQAVSPYLAHRRTDTEKKTALSDGVSIILGEMHHTQYADGPVSLDTIATLDGKNVKVHLLQIPLPKMTYCSLQV